MKLFGNTRHCDTAGRPEGSDIPVTDKSRPRDEAGEDEQIIDDEYAPLDDGTYDEDDVYDEEYGEYDEDASDEDYDEYDEYDADDGDPVKKRLSTPKKVLIIGLSCLVVVLIGCGLFVNYLLDLINYQKANSDYFITVSSPEDLPEETAINEELAAIDQEERDKALEATPEELEKWNSQLALVTSDDSTYEVPISEDVYNILLVGSDARDLSQAARSDAMILVSLNQKSKTIYLTSFLRDCYVSIPGYGNTKLNHAFAYGGPALLMETLEKNFKVHVDKYAAVNFYSFMDAIDVLGGVYINVTDEELKVTNDYIWSMNKLLEEDDPVADYLWSSGWHLLNGKQALAYARNRYTGDDYARTQRQRNIIYQLINGAMSSSPATLVSLAQVILPQITTDMEKTEILSYAANVGAYLDYEIVSQQIPVKGTYSSATISDMSVITLDLDDNIEYLQGTIYAGTEYGTPLPSVEPSPVPSEQPSAEPSAEPTVSPSKKPVSSPQPSTGKQTTPQPSADKTPAVIAPPGESTKPSPSARSALNEQTEPTD